MDRKIGVKFVGPLGFMKSVGIDFGSAFKFLRKNDILGLGVRIRKFPHTYYFLFIPWFYHK